MYLETSSPWGAAFHFLPAYFLLVGVSFLKIEFEQEALSGDGLPSLVCVITGTDGNTMSRFRRAEGEEWARGLYRTPL